MVIKFGNKQLKKLVFIILLMIVPFIFISCSSQKNTTEQANIDANTPASDSKTQAKDKAPSAKTDEKGKEYKTHTVQQGETLSLIAKKYNVTVDAIVKLNNIDDANFIVAGQKIQIPEPEEPEKK